MSECIDKLRVVVKRFKAGGVDGDTFGDEVCHVLVEHIHDQYSEADVNIIVKLLDQMRDLGVGDEATCQEIAGYFRKKVVDPVTDAGREQPSPPPGRDAAPPSRASVRQEAGDSGPQGPSVEAGAVEQRDAPRPGREAPASRPSRRVGKGADGRRTAGNGEDGHWAAARLAILAGVHACLVLAGLVIMLSPGNRGPGSIVLLAGFVVFTALLTGLCWQQLGGKGGGMVGLVHGILLCVPVLQVLWYFVACAGLGKAIRKRRAQLGIVGKKPGLNRAALFSLLALLVLGAGVAMNSLFPVDLASLRATSPRFLDFTRPWQELAVPLFWYGGAVVLGLANIGMTSWMSRSMKPVLEGSGRVRKPGWLLLVPLLAGMGVAYHAAYRELAGLGYGYLLFW